LQSGLKLFTVGFVRPLACADKPEVQTRDIVVLIFGDSPLESLASERIFSGFIVGASDVCPGAFLQGRAAVFAVERCGFLEVLNSSVRLTDEERTSALLDFLRCLRSGTTNQRREAVIAKSMKTFLAFCCCRFSRPRTFRIQTAGHQATPPFY
jgi:hypothetical protein